jgi:rhomboid protease GluP
VFPEPEGRAVTTIESIHTSSLPAAPMPAMPAQPIAAPTPVVTAIILILMGLIFAAEISFGVQPWSDALRPGVLTLMAFGGLQYPLVVDQGQWYRLLSAPLLHLDIAHVVINGIVLWYAGRVLERMIGRSWFAAVFIIGGIAGSLMSLAVNAHNVVSVGASGAIMAVLAATFVLGFHHEAGSERRSLQYNALRLLIPSLIPLGTSFSASAVDYGAHFGGAIAGSMVAAILLVIWRQRDAIPSLMQVAAAIVALGLLATGYSAMANAHEYQIYNLQRFLIPEAAIPKGLDAIIAKAPDLVRQYPRDPRARLYKAIALVQASDLPSAETQMKIGLSEKDILRVLLTPASKVHFESYLALILFDEHRKDEAIEYAKAGCISASASLHPALVKSGLCEAPKS